MDTSENSGQDTSENQWPWATLGIGFRCLDEREIKRAYAKRLKVVRPDEDAEGFQALREAYDAALGFVKYFRSQAPVELAAWQEKMRQKPVPEPVDEPVDEPLAEPAAEPASAEPEPCAPVNADIFVDVFVDPEQCAQELWIDFCTTMTASAAAPREQLTAYLERFIRCEQLENFLVRDAFEKYAALYCANQDSDPTQRLLLVKCFKWPDDLAYFYRQHPRIANMVIEQFKQDLAFQQLSDMASAGDSPRTNVARALLKQTPPAFSFRLLQQPFIEEAKEIIEKTRAICPKIIGKQLQKDVFCWWEEKIMHPRWYTNVALLAVFALIAFVNVTYYVKPHVLVALSISFWFAIIIYTIIDFCTARGALAAILAVRKHPLLERCWLAIFLLFSTALFFEPKDVPQDLVLTPLFESVAIAFFCASAMSRRPQLLIAAICQILLIAFFNRAEGDIHDARFMIGTLPLGILLVNGGQYYCEQIHLKAETLNKLRGAWFIAALLALGLDKTSLANQTAISALCWVLTLFGLLISDTYCSKIRPSVFFVIAFFTFQLIVNAPDNIIDDIFRFLHTPVMPLPLLALAIVANIAISKHFKREFS